MKYNVNRALMKSARAHRNQRRAMIRRDRRACLKWQNVHAKWHAKALVGK